MKVSINSDTKNDMFQEECVRSHAGLYADKFVPCLFRDKLPDLWVRRRNGTKGDSGKVECIIREMYDTFADFFSSRYEQNVAVCATEYYTDAMQRYMEVVLEEFDVYCTATGQEGCYNALLNIVSGCRDFLLGGLQEELRENAIRYTLRPVSRYVRLANLRMVHLNGNREKKKTRFFVHHNNEITASAVGEALLADCRERLEYFATKAQLRYEAYVDVLRMWFANYGMDLPADTEGEEWETFRHVLWRKRKLFGMNGEEEGAEFQKRYALYVPCDCGLATCKTWRTGDEADYEISKWYGMWHDEEGECLDFTEKHINGWNYIVRRCYMDRTPKEERLHMEICFEDLSEEVWTMHFGKNLLEFTGEGSELYYIVLENLERQIMKAYCEEEIKLGVTE